ncbi:liprin-beta-1 isoform X1 [Canis lupus baileyi]|uniref:liprin-beta-1 isoform X1 n=1 Tax=Canis lupus dingo TaxID=286419 RepID=UPI0020C4E762|nr:liprin-beta-1 isoform X1 [Canis lupus dingo]XP_048958526.1 liprin-beta-1 isoform X1 [Canis lupus dingo]XP_048958527.1 liprin-beta-1 isoform X1 [Canis lupus dingo]XP_048958528.1 liprin-beta-1 isoform X1 [Canis lupus dingo]XP_048958529.1 liprin-beta-1 isoform X1 [Canis lupus dingo]XP_048958530.1 liprin-beta-1 isoform X1 [Canis lupus dingo]XP_048958531.1 liprin-beta-1 isoform X1 [Canis lupus dingo]XP_048958532.1 liprin-beta-1 isoform X1 [Canis lupus dingo]
MMSDASDMLAAALEQMDGIIAGSKALEYSNGIFDCQSPTSPFMGSLRALHVVEDLRGLLEMMDTEEKEGLRCQIPDSTAETLIEWLQSPMTNGHLPGNGEVYQERLARLENDKESLVLQVSVLTDQVEAQGEKIRDLEFCLEEHREKLNATEEMLQQELLSRTSLETQKLDLMAEISNLKLKLTAVEKDRLDYEDRFRDTEGLMQEINDLRLRVSEMDNERLQYEKKLKSTKSLMAKLSSMKIKVGQMQYEKQRMEQKWESLKDELASLKEQLEEKESEVKRLQEKLVCKMKGEGMEILDRAPLLHRIQQSTQSSEDIEVQKMKKAVESLMAANEEKDRKIEDLRQCLNRYKKMQDTVVLAQGKKGQDGDFEDLLTSSSISTLLDVQGFSDLEKSLSPTPVMGSPSRDPFNTSVPEEFHSSILQVSIPSLLPATKSLETSEKAKLPPQPDTSFEENDGKIILSAAVETQPCESLSTSSLQKSSSLGNLKKESSDGEKESVQKPSEDKGPVESSPFGSLPPKAPGHDASVDDNPFGTRKARSSFGRGFFKIKNNKRTASAPNLDRKRSASAPTLAETEKETAEHLDLAGISSRPKDSHGSSSFQISPPSPDSKKKSRGIMKLFGKLRRSQSTTFNPDDMSEPEFKRGGTRATAGPRLGWSRDLGQSNSDLDMPFAKWTKEQVCNWLVEQGLGSYLNSGKHWIASGQTLLQASQQDLEKELGIKHSLHRKKLQLALQALGSEEETNHGKLDFNWVTRWLDDIGLPQYKTQFDEGRVDGRMLHYMTIDDLLSLKVVSVLHHLSIKRAIQVLRINNFEPNCLRRRPSDEKSITPSEVQQWTNHRVMEWLRSVDLAEYAPNLRGSGVHGGLMVLEPRFNVETMAQLLNIPPSKTLLRRHLATHFNLLIGAEAQHQKRDAMELPDYVLLTATAKVKPKKLTFSNFGNLRKKKQEDGEEYVCPMELGQASGSTSKKGFKPGLDMRLYDEDDLDRLEQMEDSEGTVRQIGAFSEGINNLTHMLKEDDMFRDFAARSPSASITDEDSNV